jgi:FixJ family two-component response regulator
VSAAPPIHGAPLIHVVDDDEPLRTAVLRLLSAAGFEAQGYGSTGEFLLHPRTERPGCVLLDVRLPGPSGLDLQDAMREHGIDLPVIFLTGHADVSSSVRAMKSGAVDFLEKPVSRDILMRAVNRALARDLEGRNQRRHSDQLRARFALLTPREREVFDRVGAGKLNKVIADELGIAERTVKLHRAQLMTKLGAGSPAELGALAEQLRQLPG